MEPVGCLARGGAAPGSAGVGYPGGAVVYSIARAPSDPPPPRFVRGSGAEGNRTLDLCSAIAALSQLSYRPR